MRILNSDQVHSVCKWFGMENRSKYIFRSEMTEHDSGVDALWFNIDEQHGIKLFHTVKVALFSYHLGRVFAAMGLGPKVWGYSTLRVDNCEIPYFFMERVDVLSNLDDCEYDDEDYEDEELYDEMDAHNRLMRSVSCFYNPDVHEGNYGRRRSTGETLCLDLGHIQYYNDDRTFSLKFDE